MGGIYLHIPFCKQACHYCDFHFSTSLSKKEELIEAILKEITLRKEEVESEIETIYFGGGTPSLLSGDELDKILRHINSEFNVKPDSEISLEANPDDLDKNYLETLKQVGINRLSLGVQSFIDRDLKLMNRAHNSSEAIETLELARNHFENISADLIYGIPGATSEEFEENLNKMLDFQIPHISAYALTVEPKTALAHFVKEGIVSDVDDKLAEEQFYLLKETLENHDFVHYEFSNFGKEGYFSRNNTAYWQGKSYLGIGPSAHSYDGKMRSWNIRNNSKYIKSLTVQELPIERETLSLTDRYNEYIMTGLRTMWGVSFNRIKAEYGTSFSDYLMEQAQPLINEQLLYIDDDNLYVSKRALFLSDGISSQLFKLNLK